MKESSPTEKNVKDLGDKMKTLVDQVKLKSHLARLEAQDSWGELQNYFMGLSEDLRHLKFKTVKDAQKANLQLNLGMMEAKERWDYAKEYLNDFIYEVKGKRGKLDHARLQAHLAKMEVDENLKKALEKTELSYKSKVRPGAKKIIETIKKDIDRMSQNLAD